MAQNIHVSRRQVGVNDELGLHARLADKFVRLAKSFQSNVRVQCKGVGANGKSIRSLLSLAVECGSKLAVEARGCDAEEAVAALANLISAESHESESKTLERLGERHPPSTLPQGISQG
jgi:phosphocarrier protein HPr